MDDRRGFLRKFLAGLAGLAAAGGVERILPWRTSGLLGPIEAHAADKNLVWVEGKDPYKATVKSLESLGGMKRFLKKGQTVAILPNIGWARTVEQGACTHPEVVRALIDMCDMAGAKSITLFCNPCNDMRVCLEKSGIGAVVDDGPARFEYINKNGWNRRGAIRGCTHLKYAEIYRLVDDSDLLINCPVAKHHGGSQLTMCCKNLMGLVKDRRTMHQKLHEAIADLTMMVPHALCVLDASRILLRNGPSGGNVKDVERRDTVIAGVNPAEIDALGATLFGKTPRDIGYLKHLADRKYADLDLKNLKYDTVTA